MFFYKVITLRSIIIFFLCAAPVSLVNAQDTLGGVVNNYTRILGQGDCPDVLLVAEAAGFEEGQTVLVISMQGGAIRQDDGAGFGQPLGNEVSAGLYHWSAIRFINGNEITLVHPISEGYNFDHAVQLVGIPRLQDAVVTETLNPQAWNGETGGVLALEVTGKLRLEADLDASGQGFRGGVSIQASNDNCTSLTNADKYFYESGNWRGASKGEGIVPVISGKELGRGPQANGGGGSNTHNAGGGGGSNLAAGGRGGENREPALFNCDGKYPGLAGYALTSWPQRWFMGGGGGAGHRNNDLPATGGNGGGIIVIRAATLEFAGGEIRSDGLSGGSVSGDGAGGGGAGGTVVLDIQQITGQAIVSALGGAGGNVNNNNADRCMGPGGGGSGGQVYATLALTPLLTGGQAGLSQRSGSCGEGTNGALAGTNGNFVVQGIGEPDQETSLQILSVSADTTVCAGGSLSLTAVVQPDTVHFQWFTDKGAGWELLSDDATYSGTNTASLSIQALQQDMLFQLMISTVCGGQVLSDTVAVTLDEAGAGPVADFTYELDGFTANFINSSLGAQTYEWRITEIPFYSSAAAAPSFTFPSYGAYEVVLIAASDCGTDSVAQTIVIGGPPVAAFEGERSGANCIPFTIQWTDQSQGLFDTYRWQFPGGSPATAQEPNPLVSYSNAGEFDVILIISGPLGTDTLIKKNVVKAFSVPQPAFSYEVEGLTVSFVSSTAGDVRHSWSFGTGAVSQERDPVFTFPAPGAYDVTLNVQAGECGQSVTQTVLVFPTAIRENKLFSHIQISPNPTSGILRLKSDDPALYPLDLSFFSASGQLVLERRLQTAAPVDAGDLAPGPYWLLVRSREGMGIWKVIKQ